MSDKITVIGAGNGGTAIAAYLLSQNANVSICDLFPEYLNEIANSNAIYLTYQGDTKKVTPNMVTTNLAEAIKNSKLIMIVTPAFTHKLIADTLSPILENGQIIVLNPGRTAGALEFLFTLRNNGCKKDVIVAETQSLIYSCRKTNGNSVTIYGVKSSVEIAAIPNNKIESVIRILEPYYPQLKAVPDTLWTGFANIGSLFHPTPVIMNIGRIENDKHGFKYYWEGISPTVARMIGLIDQERLKVASEFSVFPQSAQQWLETSYGVKGESLHDQISHNKAYADIYAPDNINIRYLTEDVPTGLVPISELGKAAGILTPNIDALIQISSAVSNIDYRKTGRSLLNLGIANFSKEQIIKLFKSGIWEG